MKGIKNSLKKLSFTRLSFRDSIQSSIEEIVPDIEAKRHDYRERVAKIATHHNFEFPEDAIHPRILEALEDLEVREDDIFLFSYPASNGHLLEDMVRLMVNKDEKNRSEILLRREKTENIPVGRLEVSNLYGHIRWLKSLKSPRLLASHLPYDLLPRQLHQQPIGKIIYLARNPKDHIVAYYYHHRLKGIQISLEDFLDLYMHGYLLYGSYFDHVVTFWQLAKMHPSNVLFLTYEELKIVPFAMARLITNFLDLNLTDEELNEILSQKNVAANSIERNSIKEETDFNRKTSKKIGKFQGVLGDWVNYFSPEQTRKLDEMIRSQFESQKLYLIDDAAEAVKRLNKFGRLLEDRTNDTRRLAKMANGANDNTWTKTKSFRKKPVLTRDEAVFIRKKDKVVIIEERDEPEEREQSAWRRALTSVCCCSTKHEYEYVSF